jgi:hypothetical protein
MTPNITSISRLKGCNKGCGNYFTAFTFINLSVSVSTVTI